MYNVTVTVDEQVLEYGTLIEGKQRGYIAVQMDHQVIWFIRAYAHHICITPYFCDIQFKLLVDVYHTK